MPGLDKSKWAQLTPTTQAVPPSSSTDITNQLIDKISNNNETTSKHVPLPSAAIPTTVIVDNCTSSADDNSEETSSMPDGSKHTILAAPLEHSRKKGQSETIATKTANQPVKATTGILASRFANITVADGSVPTLNAIDAKPISTSITASNLDDMDVKGKTTKPIRARIPSMWADPNFKGPGKDEVSKPLVSKKPKTTSPTKSATSFSQSSTGSATRSISPVANNLPTSRWAPRPTSVQPTAPALMRLASGNSSVSAAPTKPSTFASSPNISDDSTSKTGGCAESTSALTGNGHDEDL